MSTSGNNPTVDIVESASFGQQIQLGRVELLTLGAEDPLYEQINLLFEKLILQSRLLVVGLKLSDLSIAFERLVP